MHDAKNDFVIELTRGTSFEPEERVFSGIWKEYERVVLESIITTFGLDGFIKDSVGGDVDTIKTVQELKQYKNERWAEKYQQRGAYETKIYHSHPNYREMVSQARKQLNEMGIPIPDTYDAKNMVYYNSGEKDNWNRAALDHVISAHEICDDPVRILSDLNPVELANDPENLRFTSLMLNSKMRDMKIKDFVQWCDEHPEKVNWRGEPGAPLPEEVKKRMLEEDKRARENYINLIEKNYYTSSIFYKDVFSAGAKRGAEMGLRQAVGYLFVEMWMSCKEEMNSLSAGCEFVDCLTAIGKGLRQGFENVKSKYGILVNKFVEGFAAGVLTSLTTTFIDIFSVISINKIRYIRMGFTPITQAGAVLFVNPENLFLGDQIKKATIILGSGAAVIAGSLVGDQLAKSPIAKIPQVGEYIVKFSSVLVSGLLSCTLLVVLDRSKTINNLVYRLNKLVTEDQNTKLVYEELLRISAELEKLDFARLEKQCLMWDKMATTLYYSQNEEELKSILIEAEKSGMYKLPWVGQFSDFMSNKNNRLVFS